LPAGPRRFSRAVFRVERLNLFRRGEISNVGVGLLHLFDLPGVMLDIGVDRLVDDERAVAVGRSCDGFDPAQGFRRKADGIGGSCRAIGGGALYPHRPLD
jgi:hypothetical protein